jgi:alpha-beta hydrolase superfamily lysophospholipase
MLASLVLTIAGGAATGAAACSSSSGGAQPGSDGGPGTVEGGGGVDSGGGGFGVTLPCTDSIDSVYADPGDVSGQAKGAILKCAHDKDVTAVDLLAASKAQDDAGTPPYAGKDYTSGAHVYRVLYRTERGDKAGSPGYSSAAAFIPDTPRASTLPVIVASHGSRGQGGACAPSKLDPAARDVNGDFIHQVYSLVGFGYAVIAPDLAGYANFGGTNNPPSAYADAADVGKSTLDGVVALRNLLPNSSLSDKVVITGHSQGGHTALSALALSGSYGVSGTIAGVAVYSPLWISQHAWGAILFDPGQYSFAQSSAGIVSLWYHYTHGELLDGQGHGTDLIQPSKQAAVQSFVTNDCWGDGYPQLADGGTSANDFFLASYANAIGLAATPIGNGNCNGDATCQTWLDRMTADWPHLTGAAAKVPILVMYANDDTTLTPDTIQCAFDRLSSDDASYSVCYDSNPVGHSGVVSVDSNYVADWIAQQALGAAAPTETCGVLAKNDGGVPQLIGPDGGPVDCNPLLSTQ